MAQTPYKIVESPEGVFKVYRKGWIFWDSLKYVMDGQETVLDEKCYSLHDAENLLARYIKRLEDSKTKPKFKMRTLFYRADGKRPDNWLRSPGPGM